MQNIERWFTQAKGDAKELMQRASQALEHEINRQEIDELIAKLEKQLKNTTDNVAEQIKELVARLKSK